MKKDITAWQIVDGYVIPQYDDGEFAEGTYDVLQRVLCVLFTETDSARYKFGRDAQRACPFMSAWRHGEIINESDIQRLFSLCQSHIQLAMNAQQGPEDEPDQIFKELTLEQIVVYPGSVQLLCRLTTGADQMTFKLPIPI